MIAFGWVTNLIQRGVASWDRLLEVLDTIPAVRDAEDSEEGSELSRRLSGAIEFRDLRFAIMGPTGSGKSTLVSLLPRIHEPPRGTVFLDGTDVRDLPLAVVRANIGMVPQDPFLFSESLAANVAFGHPGGLDAGDMRTAVESAAALARLDKDVAAFPAGYDTLVGERGLTLSGGQKQRAALARALLMDPPILILDDALSAVDTYTEEEILSRIREVMRQRTTIIVAHRVSTVRDADVILMLQDGRIVERGSHRELVARGGPYSELYRKQLLEDELAAS
jgi:ATP-binding cassette subfamily B protein